jgi:hypothetical protein
MFITWIRPQGVSTATAAAAASPKSLTPIDDRDAMAVERSCSPVIQPLESAEVSIASDTTLGTKFRIGTYRRSGLPVFGDGPGSSTIAQSQRERRGVGAAPFRGALAGLANVCNTHS